MDIFVGTLFIITCILLILVVLLQKGRGGGLGAAFGGGGGGAFGTRTGDVFTWVTITLTALFLLLAIGTTIVYRQPTGTVTAPIFLPAPGEIDEAKDVTSTCAVKGAIVRYTLDGSDPTDKSTAFEGSIRVEPGTTIKARAYRAGWKPSPVVIARYTRKDSATTIPTSVPATFSASRPAVQP